MAQTAGGLQRSGVRGGCQSCLRTGLCCTGKASVPCPPSDQLWFVIFVFYSCREERMCRKCWCSARMETSYKRGTPAPWKCLMGFFWLMHQLSRRCGSLMWGRVGVIFLLFELDLHLWSDGLNCLLVLSGPYGHTVKQYCPSGKLLQVLGSPGKAGSSLSPIQFDQPAEIFVHSSGEMYIVDGDGGMNNRLMKLSKGAALMSCSL